MALGFGEQVASKTGNSGMDGPEQPSRMSDLGALTLLSPAVDDRRAAERDRPATPPSAQPNLPRHPLLDDLDALMLTARGEALPEAIAAEVADDLR